MKIKRGTDSEWSQCFYCYEAMQCRIKPWSNMKKVKYNVRKLNPARGLMILTKNMVTVISSSEIGIWKAFHIALLIFIDFFSALGNESLHDAFVGHTSKAFLRYLFTLWKLWRINPDSVTMVLKYLRHRFSISRWSAAPTSLLPPTSQRLSSQEAQVVMVTCNL